MSLFLVLKIYIGQQTLQGTIKNVILL